MSLTLKVNDGDSITVPLDLLRADLSNEEIVALLCLLALPIAMTSEDPDPLLENRMASLPPDVCELLRERGIITPVAREKRLSFLIDLSKAMPGEPVGEEGA